jgi:hypothetical protein
MSGKMSLQELFVVLLDWCLYKIITVGADAK